MSSSTPRSNARPFYPPRLSSFSHSQAQPLVHAQTQRDRRGSSPSSDASSTSQAAASYAAGRPSPYLPNNAAAFAAASSTGVNIAAAIRSTQASPLENASVRGPSPAMASVQQDYHRHRPRQHSQGFFEPSLPTASQTGNSPTTGSLSASQIAAQAAMHVQSNQHGRQRSQTIPEPVVTTQNNGRRKGGVPSPISTTLPAPPATLGATPQPRSATSIAPSGVSAASAASAAYPRSPLASPPMPPYTERAESPMSEREQKPGKERSRMKLFSKNKSSNLLKDKDGDKKVTIMQSPTKVNIYSHPYSSASANQSTTSLADSVASGSTSMYAISNASSSTLVPAEKVVEKEKHRPNFLSRQRHKHKDKEDHRGLTLSSASSNSKPTDPSAPKSLYSFVPSSPGPNSSTFNKSISGLNLRHGGHAFRDKKKEERTPVVPSFSVSSATSDSKDREASLAPHHDLSSFGPASGTSVHSLLSEISHSSAGLMGIGLPGMTAEDAWPYLKSRLLNIFEGQDISTPVEDFNRLVVAHLQRCIQRRAPNIILEDVRELLHTGFLSLDHTLRKVPDDKLVPYLVDMWASVFGTVLPFMQAVFLPLDLEFKGRGPILSSREAADFWGAAPGAIAIAPSRPSTSSTASTASTIQATSASSRAGQVAMGSLLDVRTLVLVAFRDTIVLPRFETLFTIFSRLSLDSINARPAPSPEGHRPGTAASSASLSATDPSAASYNSQGSTVLDSSTAGSGSLGARSRATSNTSAGSFHSLPSIPQTQRPHASSHGSSQSHTGRTEHGSNAAATFAIDSSRITQTVGRMLQCVSVLASLQIPGSGSTDNPSAIASSSATANYAAARSRTRAGTLESSTSTTTSGGTDETDHDMDDTDSVATTGAAMDPEVVARKKMERLCKELNLNWLGRGRTGRNRRGFVGTKLRSPPTIISTVG